MESQRSYVSEVESVNADSFAGGVLRLGYDTLTTGLISLLRVIFVVFHARGRMVREADIMKRWISIALGLSLMAVGCSGPGESGEGADGGDGSASTTARVAFVTNNASDFWKLAEAGTRAAAADLGVEVLFRIPPNGTAQEQQQILEDLVARGVDGIAISPNDPQNWTGVLNNFAAQVPIVTQDSDAPESDRACYIGTDNYQAGQAAAELIKKSLPDGGKIMLFVGTLDAQNAQDRKRGIEDTLAGTSIEIVDTRTDDADRSRAVANVEDALVTHSDLAGLVGLWSYNGPAILQGVKSADKLGAVQIITFDEEADVLQGIIDGHIAGTIVQQPYEFGYQSVKLLSELARGDSGNVPETKQLIVPVKTIDAANVEAFWTELKELRGQ